MEDSVDGVPENLWRMVLFGGSASAFGSTSGDDDGLSDDLLDLSFCWTRKWGRFGRRYNNQSGWRYVRLTWSWKRGK